MAEQKRRIRRRTLDSYHRGWLGLTAVLVVGALIGASLIVKAIDIGYRGYTAQFAQAAALRAGNPVTIAGVPVGSVTSVRLAGDHVSVRMKIRDQIRLGSQTRAKINITTILGSRYLELRPSGPDALADNTIDLSHTEVPYDLQTALNDATTTFEQVDADRVAESLDVLSAQLQGLPQMVPDAMENIHTLSTIMARRRDQLGTLLVNSEQVTNTLRRQQGTLGTLVNQGQDLVGEFVTRRASFHAILAGLTTLLDNLGYIVIDDRSQVDQLANDLSELTAMLSDNDDKFRDLLQVMPIPLRELANATGFGNAVEFNAVNGIVVDSWACAISGRAKQFQMIEYFKDCK